MSRNRFIMRCFFDELLSNILQIDKFFQFMIMNKRVVVIVQNVNTNVVNDLKHFIYRLN